MSYVVSIVRDRPIDEAEVRILAGEFPGIEIESADGTLMLHWQVDGDGDRETFVLTDGSLDVTTPSDEGLRLAQSFADRLGAQVVGEEGEDLTDVDVATPPATGCGAFVGAIVLIAVLLAVYWFVIR